MNRSLSLISRLSAINVDLQFWPKRGKEDPLSTMQFNRFLIL